MKRGYTGIGIECCKTVFNYGTLFRTAQIFEADFIFLIGKRFKKQSSDTLKSWRHMPLYEYEDFNDFHDHKPYNCLTVGIELDKNAVSIKHFVHPERAIYLLGAEDNGLSKTALECCNWLVQLPGKSSLNVSVAGSIVLYDRHLKSKEN